MKKYIFIVITISFLLLGCSTMNSPTKKVEEFFNKYQTLDSSVLTSLDKVVSNDKTLNKDQKKEYINLMKKQYQNMSYKIKEEKEKKDASDVYVEVEVYDYRSSLDNSEKYIENNKEKFKNDDGSMNKEKIMDYKITELKKVIDRKKENIILTLSKVNNNWIMDNITETDRQKLHGMYKN